MSKIVKRAINSQLPAYFSLHFNPFLSVFLSGYGCQTTLLRIVEDWKQALDKNYCLAAVFMDLSKAFDCLAHDILIAKLKHYGLTESSLNLTHSHTMTPFDAPGKQARFDKLLPFSANLKLSSANSFSLEESKICHLVMG